MDKKSKLAFNIQQEPIVLALSLDKKRQREHIVIGARSRVYSYFQDFGNENLLYNEVRPLGTLLLEHEAQSIADWNEYVHTPFTLALGSIVGRSNHMKTATAFLNPHLDSQDAICKFTSHASLQAYKRFKTIRNVEKRTNGYQSLAANISRSFRQVIWGDKKNSTIQQATDRVQQMMLTNGFQSDTTAQIWYPGRRCRDEWIVVQESLCSVILYYLRQLNDWGMCFCRCNNCGKIFIADSLHHSLCSKKCHQARNRQNKREFDERAKKNGYDIDYKNTSQRMRNRLNTFNSRENVSEEQTQEAVQWLSRFRQDALQKKKQIQTAEDYQAFRNWLFEQERDFEQFLNEKTIL